MISIVAVQKINRPLKCNMPSKKKKKARDKTRRTKSRKEDDDGAVNDIDSEMQRLKIGSSGKNQVLEDEDALLEAAINLAAAEREELETAARSDAVNNSQICKHGFVLVPSCHLCLAFMGSYAYEFEAAPESDDTFGYAYEATKTKFAEVWNDPDNLNWIASRFISRGTDTILEGNYSVAGRSAMLASFFEQWAAVVLYQNETQASCDWDNFVALCDWSKIFELWQGDEHTLVSFYRKRIPCKCLDKRYEEVKSIKKIGFCQNDSCFKKTIRCEMLSCTQCRKANYCSRECQVANWPTHKQFCVVRANISAALKSTQKE